MALRARRNSRRDDQKDDPETRQQPATAFRFQLRQFDGHRLQTTPDNRCQDANDAEYDEYFLHSIAPLKESIGAPRFWHLLRTATNPNEKRDAVEGQLGGAACVLTPIAAAHDFTALVWLPVSSFLSLYLSPALPHRELKFHRLRDSRRRG